MSASLRPGRRRANAIEGGQRLLVDEIAKAPANVRRTVLSEISELSKSQFLTPYSAWGAVLAVLDRHMPALAADARPFIAALAGHECDSTA